MPARPDHSTDALRTPRWIRLLIFPILPLAFLGLCILHLVFLAIGVYDTKPKDYPQMERVEWPGPQVPLADLLAAEPTVAAWQAAYKNWDESDNYSADRETLAMLDGRTDRDEAAIALWRKKQELGIVAIKALLDRSGEQLWTQPIPEEFNPIQFSFGDDTEIRRLAAAIRWQCRLAAHNPATCADLAILGKRLNSKIQHYDSTMSSHLVAATVQNEIDMAALEAAHSCVQAKNSTHLEQLATCFHDGFTTDQQQSLANALRGEFHFGCDWVRWIRKDMTNPSQFAINYGAWNDAPTWELYWAVLRIQPNRYAARHATEIESWIKLAPLPLASHPAKTTGKKVSVWQRIDPSPQAGVAFYEQYLGNNSTFIKFIEFSARQIAHNTLCRTAIAIARYRLANNDALPTNLGDLVPGYLPATPLDPIDAKPLRYDAAMGRLWSIGTDCKDDGGAGSAPSDDVPPGYLMGKDAPDMVVDLKAFFAGK